MSRYEICLGLIKDKITLRISTISSEKKNLTHLSNTVNAFGCKREDGPSLVAKVKGATFEKLQ